ncbi:hypothetical protein [Pandoraea pnomenusa]
MQTAIAQNLRERPRFLPGLSMACDDTVPRGWHALSRLTLIFAKAT